MSRFIATKAKVSDRGEPPDSFLDQLVAWGRSAADEIFAKNDNPADIYALIAPRLGPWLDLPHRRAAMLEAMRVHAGFESSWNWNEGVDTTNASSLRHASGQETGIFQVSFDSTWLDKNAMTPFALAHEIGTVTQFIPAMKTNHPLALEYYGRLVRVSIAWAGPLKRHEVDPFLSKAAVAEFQSFLAV